MAQSMYRTVCKAASVEIVIRKSRFLGHCYPITQEAEALALLSQIRKQHWDASHNCYAYSVRAGGATARFSDDGEPGGTAGMPMMEVLKEKNVTDVLCVVTRYFGGVLLGAGGLVRAYAKTASEVINAAGLVEMRPCTRYTVKTEYPRWGMLEGVLRSFGSLEDTSFTEHVCATVLVEADNTAAFEHAVVERSDGRCAAQEIEAAYGAFPVE